MIVSFSYLQFLKTVMWNNGTAVMIM